MSQSFINKKDIPSGEEIQSKDLRNAVYNYIKNLYPEISKDDYISITELNQFRRQYLTSLIEQEKGEIATLDADVLHAINTNSILSENIETTNDKSITTGQRIADKVATFGGSWKFIIIFMSFLTIWMLINAFVLLNKGFDPYPFILLNLILSCVAAIQAPIIMMSQNRQEEKDRARAEQDYKINLKAELEIKLLSEKIDHLIVNQNRKLLEIQEVQTDYLDDLMKEIKKRS
ncbi:DUF1003 domain-containing protein [Sphingobacterium bovistauri]|uniref:DUF1003 domain-containing protein n=1 Tax=Sphingobacterium bovistauri TaxID=2781959 RepID=A0ABS7ZA68_9SPHI|nr:DUF1003 domain-containing protein [Sphingobacterium bovistauri]MCA5006477.1 DUF1003 domain-containing protein [Sphingobacterium bovistauri]